MQQRALIVAIAIAALILVALVARRTIHAVSELELPTTHEDPFVYATVDRTVAALAPDPRSSGGLFDVPRGRLGLACEGDEEAVQSIEDRAHELIARGEDRARVGEELALLQQQCFAPATDTGICQWALAEIDAGDLADLAWTTLAWCPSRIAAPAFDRADAPATAVLSFVWNRMPGAPGLEAPPRLPSQFARAAIERASSAPSTPVSLFATTVRPIRYDDAVAAEQLLAAYDATTNHAEQLALGQALDLLSNSRARDVARLTCAERMLEAASLLCAAEGSAVAVWLDPAAHVERNPADRERVIAELDACARGNTETALAPFCLRGLAELDWERARAVPASSQPTIGLPGALGRGAAALDLGLHSFERTLARFPSADAMMLTLRTRDLLGAPVPMHRAPLTIPETMVAYGRGWSSGQSAVIDVGHDRLARHLARLASPGLDDVVFDEVLPDAGELVLGLRQVELVAYTRSERFAVLATSDDEHYDLGAVVGLLNVLLRERGQAVRYLIVDDPFDPELVVVGPADALEEAIAEELLVPLDPGDLTE